MNHIKEYVILVFLLKLTLFHTVLTQQQEENLHVNKGIRIKSGSNGSNNKIYEPYANYEASLPNEVFVMNNNDSSSTSSDKVLFPLNNKLIRRRHVRTISSSSLSHHIKNGSQTIKRDIHFAILLPTTLPLVQHTNLSALVLTAMDLAIKKLRANNGLLSQYNVFYEYKDTRCSSTYGPLAAFDLYIVNKPDAFFGPMCDYVLAPVSRYAGVWGIPLLTAGGIAETFINKAQYPTLTRLLTAGYVHVGYAVKNILSHFNWTIAAVLYHNHDDRANKGNSPCSLAMAPIFRALNSTESVHQEFDENVADKEKLMTVLQFAKRNARSKYFSDFLLYKFNSVH